MLFISILYLITTLFPRTPPKTNAQLIEQGEKCHLSSYLIVDQTVFCFRGNWDYSRLPPIQKTSAQTGIDIVIGTATHDLTNMVAVYIEDVGDLGFFWKDTGLFK